MEAVEVLDDLAYHEKQIAYHQAQGPTSKANLGPFCRYHHRVKHRSAWETSQPRPGWFRFRSPAGKVYHRQPEPALDDPPPF